MKTASQVHRKIPAACYIQQPEGSARALCMGGLPHESTAALDLAITRASWVVRAPTTPHHRVWFHAARRPGNALEASGPEIPELEEIAEQPARAVGDDHRIRLGESL